MNDVITAPRCIFIHAGFCYGCGSERMLPKGLEHLCGRCVVSRGLHLPSRPKRPSKVRDVKQMPFKAYAKILRDEHLAEGLCSKLCGRPRVPGQTRCAPCARYNVNLVRHRFTKFKEAGLCQACGEYPPKKVDGFRCAPCLETRRLKLIANPRPACDRTPELRQREKKYRDKRRNAGLCTGCVKPSKTYRCEACRAKRRVPKLEQKAI